jgi:preprotein translocase subunit SecA
MDYLRSSVSLKAWGQRDPLVEFQREGRRLFGEMEASVSARLGAILVALAAAPSPAPAGDAVVETARAAVAGAAGRDEGSDAAAQDKIGRNDLVTVVRGDERQTLKWKKAEALLADGWKIEKVG